MRTCCGAGHSRNNESRRNGDGMAYGVQRTFQGEERCDIARQRRSGRKHAREVARNLLPVAKAVKIIELPGLPEKGDIVNWADDGHTKKELLKLGACRE